MNQPIRQHFTPRSYLSGFTPPEFDDLLIVYSKLGDKQRISSPLREGYECYLYEQELADGTHDKFSVEKLLEPLDSEGATLIREISTGLRLDPQRQWNLAFYIGMMVARNPLTMSNLAIISKAMMRDELSRENDVDAQFENLRADHPDWPQEALRSLAERVVQMAKVGSYDIKLPKGYSIRFFGAATKFAETLFSMQWNMLQNTSGFFITSDNPVFFGHYGPTDRGPGLNYGQLGHPGALVVFPITRQWALVATKNRPQIVYRKATSHDINVVNDHCVAAAARWVYSPFRSNKIAKLVLARQGESYKLTPDSPFTADIVRTWNADRSADSC